MRLIKRDALMSWTSLKESRTLNSDEYVNWTRGSCWFSANDIPGSLNVLDLIDRLFENENPLTKFLRGISDIPIVEEHQGFTVTKSNTETLRLALDQSIKALKQAVPNNTGMARSDMGPARDTLVKALNHMIGGGLIYDEERFADVVRSEATQTLLQRHPQGESLVCLNRMLLEDAFPSELPRRIDHTAPPLARLVFVSHRWITQNHPDPDGVQLRELQQRLDEIASEDASFKESLIFYDYSSILQMPRTAEEDVEFDRDLGSLRALCRMADCVIVLSEGYSDYKNRSWCFFELAATERNRIRLFDDQKAISEDLAFANGMMVQPTDFGVRGFVTSQKMNYKLSFPEIESILAVFQHLRTCRATHPEDIPRIRLEMVRHFNSREATAFGRLIVALAKFFEIEVVAAAVSGTSSGPAVCKPYFGEPEWKRLPVPGRQEPSKFAVPADRHEELTRNGYLPLLRLTKPGITNYQEFLQEFQRAPNWKDFVVSPIAAAGIHSNPEQENDCFPTIDHVVHTVLARQPGFMLGPQCLYIPMTNELENHLKRRMKPQ